MSDVYIVGVDMIKFGRFPEKSVPEIGAEAALLALDDAGLKIQQMEALYWIVQLGSFEAASSRLNTTQSAVSKRIQELERAFDHLDAVGFAAALHRAHGRPRLRWEVLQLSELRAAFTAISGACRQTWQSPQHR